VHVKFNLAISSFVVKNINVSKYLLLHTMMKSQNFSKLRSVSFVNTLIPEELCLLLLESIKHFAGVLEKLEFVGIKLSDKALEYLCDFLLKGSVKSLVV
jgi:hypothetical protein